MVSSVIAPPHEKDLENRLKTLWEQKRAHIVIVDNHCAIGGGSPLFDEHRVNEEAIGAAALDAEVDYWMSDGGFAQINDPNTLLGSAVRSGTADIVLINAHTDDWSEATPNMYRAALTASELKQAFPSAAVYYIMPTFPHSPMGKVLIKLVSLAKIPVPVIEMDAEEYPTAMHFLNSLLTGYSHRSWGSRRTLSARQHEYKNHVWQDNYLPMIDSSLCGGNTQSDLSYHFVVISDREIALLGDNEIDANGHKVVVCSSTAVLDRQKLDGCAAIFIDNSWDEHNNTGALGGGIEVLRRLRAQLDKNGINIPILYQSGHARRIFTRAEVAQVESLGAVLAAKDVFPKVCRTRGVAKKETVFSRLAEANPILALYTTRVLPYGCLGGDDLSVVCTRMVGAGDASGARGSEGDAFERDKMQQCGVTYDMTSHKMYVLAALHSYLKSELSNPDLAATSRDFVDFHELNKAVRKGAGKAAAKTLKTLRPLYDRIVEEHRGIPARVITHNDAKWDNWFQGTVLGDFGSVRPGTEYKDVARALYAPADAFATALDRKKVRECVQNYLTLRKSMDKDFKQGAGFAQRTEEMMFVEGLRMLSHHGKEDYALALARVVEYWGSVVGVW